MTKVVCGCMMSSHFCVAVTQLQSSHIREYVIHCLLPCAALTALVFESFTWNFSLEYINYASALQKYELFIGTFCYKFSYKVVEVLQKAMDNISYLCL